MLLRPWFLVTTAAYLVAATGNVVGPRDFAAVEGALDNVNTLLLQINNQITGLNTQNIATQGPALIQLSSSIQSTLGSFSQQVATSAPLTVDETNGLNTARMAFAQNVNLTMANLIADKPLFDMVNLSSQVAGILQTVHDQSENLFGQIQSKLAPSDSTTAVTTTFLQALDVFEMAVAVFNGQAAVMPTPAAAVPPTLGNGTINSDGSCNCNVICPAGSFM
ncbi:hypothetical protein N0V82_002582 [Gnomoniopsis sp. IMI 355080]|nr:hypothetical protein N0V82_002582 [Gnomoniopsis sp. IMI 355080]